MNRFLLLIPTALLAAGVVAADDAQTLKKLEGTWVMTAGERDGVKFSPEHVKGSKITFKGAESIVEVPQQSKETIKAAIGVDTSKTPAQMHWVRSNGPDAGQKMLAIFEFIDGDTYRICFAPAGKDRPTEFATTPGSGRFMHTWKRVAK